MNKIMAVNAGSSSLKFQLFEMPSEEVLTSGVVERIGFKDGIFTIKVNGEKSQRLKQLLITKKEMEIRKNREYLWYSMVLLISVLLTSSYGYIYFRNKKKQQQQKRPLR